MSFIHTLYPISLKYIFLVQVPYIPPPNVESSEIDHETVFLNWESIGPQHVPGTLSGYVIKYRKYHGNQTTTHYQTATLRTLRGLKPNTLYWIEIMGYTTAGHGPESLIIVTTPKGRMFKFM